MEISYLANQTPSQFFVVGVGASAGGLDSFKRLIRSIPPDSGMAYVLVQHLSPNHDSLLPELLSPETSLKVHEITDEIHLEPDNIYIIPENKILTAFDGVLKLSPRNFTEKPNYPIDIFFNSLAETHRSFAIGVVLSGTGMDGTNGLKSINEVGGSTIAQEPATAAFEGMPLSALQSGSVDFVLPPEDIPRQLQHIREAYLTSHAHLENEKIPKPDEDVFFQMIKILQVRTNNDFSHYKQAMIRRRIARRMVLKKLDNPRAYLSLLRIDKNEQDALFNDILIPVSYFFRDTKTFDHLEEHVFDHIVKGKTSHDKIRIWSAGCSTGEEAYSLAIKIHEYLMARNLNLKVQIFASDISPKVIAKARLATYTKQDLTNVSEARIKDYFTKTEGNYVINKIIREMCIFAVHNFLKDPPFARMDLISCRNVLIYLDPFLQTKALTTFHYALRPEGKLLLGKSETASNSSLFVPSVKNEKIYTRKQVPGHFTPNSFARVETTQILKEQDKKMPAGTFDFQKLAFDILFTKYTPVAVIVNEHRDIVYFHGDSSPYLRTTKGKPSFNLMKMAREGLDFELRNALIKAKKANKQISVDEIAIKSSDKEFTVNIEVTPMEMAGECYYLIVFIKNPVTVKMSEQDRREADVQRIVQLEAELVQIREDIRTVNETQEATIEELQSANEELLSGSEELQTLNEEMETAAEEMQSNNEELISVNDELMDRQEQLTAARNYAEAIISSIREPLLILTRDLRIKSSSKSYYKFFKVSELETEGMPFFEVGMKQWYNPELKKLMENVLPSGIEIENYEFSGEFRDIGSRCFLINAKSIVSEKYSDPLILVSIDDITNSKLYADQKAFTKVLSKQVQERTVELERYNKELESYNYIASHDLQEPIRKILIFSSRFLEREKTNLSPQSLRILEGIGASATRMQNLIQALLEYSVSNNKANPPVKKVDLAQLFDQVASDLEGTAQLKKVKLERGDLPVLKVVPEQFRQLFSNLISNGIKYSRQSDEPSYVKVWADEAEVDGVRYIKLYFKDNGIGFDQKYESKIFELFQRLHGKLEYSGTGIGLAICKKIAGIHKGTIRAEAEVGVGTTFVVMIPENLKNPKSDQID